ncbi:MAG: 4-alpha-glucanotransferase [bacterium]|nr:4-alpha-glucanotransferase [bacterium]
MRRSSGILLHPTSLPGRFGIGDLGPEADRFLDWVRDAGAGWWQVLPLTAPDSHGSPYSCPSAFAGNPLLISPELLHRQGLLEDSDLDDVPAFPAGRVAFAEVGAWKSRLLRRSWELFGRRATAEQRESLERFRETKRAWLDDWTLFATLKRHHEDRGWWQWDDALRRREPDAIEAARREHGDEIDVHAYLQWLFFDQWQRLKDAARERGIRMIGDLPIYVALDSAEVWASPWLFELDDDGRPLAVSGCPPDDYSDTGQLWGNPLYRWDRMAEDGYSWWVARLSAALETSDLVRIDHFRGFAGFWRVPAGDETAENGAWVDGPGMALFDALREALGELPLIAEDLGVITPDVEELRRDAGLPGMKVLQFAFGAPNSEYLPHRYERDSVVYTGTHDNDTTRGWYRGLDRAAKRRVRAYSGSGARRVHQALIRLAYTSAADLAVVPMQDVLGLGSEARMNTPAVEGGNWSWRLEESMLDPKAAGRLRSLAELTGRLP